MGRLLDGLRLHRVSARVAVWPLCLTLLALSGCSTFADRTAKIRSALDENTPERALDAANAALGVSNAEQTPSPLEKNDALLLLDRGTVLQALGRHPDSSRDFETADKAIEVLDFKRSTVHEIGKYMFSDSIGPYKARPFEKLMINTLNMINYLARGDLEGAKVEARRFSVMREFLEGKDGKAEGVDDAAALGSLIAGFTFEQAGEAGEALRYYDEALRAASFEGLAVPVKKLMSKSGYRTERLNAVAKHVAAPVAGDASQSDVLIVVGHGRVPALDAERLPIGAALLLSAAYLPLDSSRTARRLAGQGLVTWVNHPKLAPMPSTYESPVVTVDGTAQPVELVANVDALLHQAWEQTKAQTVAAAVVRLVARAAIGAGAGAAAGKGSGKSELGALIAFVTQGALAAADKPDTRSWATLPARVTAGRVRLAPGAHVIEVQVGGSTYKQDVQTVAGGWTVISVMDLSRLGAAQ